MTSRRLRLVTFGVALAASAALALPATASSAPPEPNPLTQAIDRLVSTPNLDQTALQAAQTIVKMVPVSAKIIQSLVDAQTTHAVAPVAQTAAAPVAQSVAGPEDLIGAYQTAVQALQQLGINPFLYPTAAPFCADGPPLGLAPAVAGAVPGPWPGISVPFVGDLNAVKAGQTLFAFVPAGLGPDGANTAGMQVAWFNVNTLKGGFTQMGTIPDLVRNTFPNLPPQVQAVVQNFFTAAVNAGGVRAVPVETGSGTVLAAVFGNVQNGAKNCFFFPTVGITNVK